MLCQIRRHVSWWDMPSPDTLGQCNTVSTVHAPLWVKSCDLWNPNADGALSSCASAYHESFFLESVGCLKWQNWKRSFVMPWFLLLVILAGCWWLCFVANVIRYSEVSKCRRRSLLCAAVHEPSSLPEVKEGRQYFTFSLLSGKPCDENWWPLRGEQTKVETKARK